MLTIGLVNILITNLFLDTTFKESLVAWPGKEHLLARGKP
jgi:hypothetical protein